MNASIALTVSFLSLAGCYKVEVPALEYVVARTSLDLGKNAFDGIPRVEEFSLLNTGGGTLIVTPLRFDGDGSAYLQWEYGDYSEVVPGASTSIPVTLVEDTRAWDSGDWTASLVVEVGALWNDPRDWSPDPTWTQEDLTVPISFSLLCDLDGDGAEATECGGDDCDDFAEGVVAPADETCNGLDDDCDGEVDEDSVDARVWFVDADADGWGDPTTGALACEAPSGTVPDDTDCDDTNASVHPGAAEVADGADQDCDELVDEDFLTAGDIVVTEFFVDPAGSGQIQWFEVVNVAVSPRLLAGWEISVDDGTGPRRIWVSPAAGLTVDPGGVLLFCQNAADLALVASGLTCAYEYGIADNGLPPSALGPASDPSLALTTPGTLTISAGGWTLDAVSWDSTWPIVEGSATALSSTQTNANANDAPSAWCSATETWDDAGLEAGTPGQPNEACIADTGEGG